MSISVKKIALADHPVASTHDAHPIQDNYLDLLGNVEVNCLVRLGTVTMTINELRQLQLGQVLSLQQKTQEPIDIVLNDQVIARGELMCCEDYFAIQITEKPLQ